MICQPYDDAESEGCQTSDGSARSVVRTDDTLRLQTAASVCTA